MAGCRALRAAALAAAALTAPLPLLHLQGSGEHGGQAAQALMQPCPRGAGAGLRGRSGTPTPRAVSAAVAGPRAAAAGLVEAAPPTTTTIATDPFARLTAVLRRTQLDKIASLLDGSVDIAAAPLRRASPSVPGALEDPTPAKSLWAAGGALIVAVRRPGCWLCREEAFRLAQMLEDDPSLSQVRLVAVLKENRLNEDGSSEVELFKKYFPNGDVYVDETRSFYKALGSRSLLNFFSREGLAYAKQRASGLKEFNIQGNFNGLMTEPLLLGGILLVAPSGQVLFVHQEAAGPVQFEDLEVVVKELSEAISASQLASQQAAEKSWLEWAVDSWMGEFK